MEIIKVNATSCYLNQTELSSTIKQTSEVKAPPNSLLFDKSLKVADYFDFLYSYPPKIKIKWDNLDPINYDTFSYPNWEKMEKLGYFDPSNPIITGPELVSNSELSLELIAEITAAPGKAISENYATSEYFNGLLNKVNSSNFFLKKTKEIQSLLTNIPVFVVLNGQGEIILNKPSSILSSQNVGTYLNEKLYDWCGGFDFAVEKKPKFGCFFMNFADAEQYLKEVARFDIEGTQTVGLSIYCTNLGSAYKVTREYHPGIDFRFVPHFDEVKNLLGNNNIKSGIVFEDEQQQFRLQPKNFIPGLNMLGVSASFGFNSVKSVEYFKGVPIYIVQLSDEPNIVLQGSDDIPPIPCESKKYIFFEKQQAIKFCKFCKKNGRKIVPPRNKGINFMSSKPIIKVYNLEDFLEDWEDDLMVTVTKNVYNFLDTNSNGGVSDVTFFVSPTENLEQIKNISYLETLQFPVINKVTNYLIVNYRVLKSAIGIFFSV